MHIRFSVLAIAGAAAALSACSTSDTLYHEGVTSYAGDAIAANTMLQMVDPWQYGVQYTDLKTPAERPSQGANPADGSSAKVAQP